MGTGKRNYLVVSILVVTGLLFAGGEAGANFNNFCYTVTATTSPQGDRPTTFIYTFNPLAGCNSSTSVKNVLFEIPWDVKDNAVLQQAQYSTPSTSNSYLPLSCTYLGRGVGDSETRLGVGDNRYNVLSCISPTSGGFPKSYNIKLVLTQPLDTSIYLCKSSQVVQLKAGNSLSDSDVTDEPSICTKPALPPPVITSFSASPNPVQQISGNSSSTCTKLSWNATFATGDSGTVSISGGGVTHTGGASGTVDDCPSATTTYTATAKSTSNGSTATATTTVTVKPPVNAGAFDYFKAEPSSITSGEQPLCVTLSWNVSPGTVSISAKTIPAGTVTSLASGLPGTGSYVVCPTETTEYTATASSSGEPKSTVVTVTVDAPVIQTSCMQILKVSKALGVPTCLNVCFEVGGEKRLISADLYPNATCEPGTGVPLAIFGPDVAFEPYRVSALQCSPCDRPIGPNGEVAPACPPGSDYLPGKEPPFVLSIPSTVTGESTYKLMCNKIIKEYEPSGFTLDLGADPTYFNGSRWVTYTCPPGYRDTGTACVKY